METIRISRWVLLPFKLLLPTKLKGEVTKKNKQTKKQKKNRKIKAKANVNTQKIPSFIKQKMLMKILIAWRTVLLNTAL